MDSKVFRERSKIMEIKQDLDKVHLQYLFDNALDVAVLVDPSGNVCRVNSYFERLFALKEEEIIGKSIIDLAFPPHSRNRAKQAILELQKGEKIELSEVQCMRKDETTFPCRVVVFPILFNSKVASIYVVFYDLTQKNEREKQLLYASAVVKESPVVFFRLKADEGWPIIYASENVSRWGYTSELLVRNENSYLGIIYEEDREKIIRQVRFYEEAGREEYELEYRILTGKGDIIWVNEMASVLRDDYGRALYYQCAVKNVTTRKEAEIALSLNYHKMSRAWDQTIEVMAITTEMKDPFAVGHQKRVASLSCAIAVKLGLKKEEVHNLEKAALVHDIGRVEIPSELLSKPGPLTDAEFELVQTHSEIGFAILSRIDLPWPLAEIVHQHHERIDGSGYPRGLKGDKILLPAKIISVADIVEAMTSHRPYRPALGIDATLDEIEKLKGVALDETVVDSCVKLFRENEFSFIDE
jgi:PAS domain S-box-containing protein/putative nucleotidyltransferase with HDIG domain